MTLPLGFEVRPLRDELVAGAASVEHVAITLRAEEVRRDVRPSLVAVLVLDVSGSMSGDPLEHVVRSAQRMAEILDEGDRLGVVCFDDEARVVTPVRRLDAAGRREVQRAVGRLATGGCTNLAGGIECARALFGDRGADERHIALVMSDGHPNVGLSSAEDLGALAGSLKADGVAVSTLGFGASHDEDLLVAIADGGGGVYALVTEPRLADASFARALGAQRDIVAEDVALVLRPAGGVEIAKVFGEPKTSFGADGMRVHLPDAIGGDEMTCIVELAVDAPRETGAWCPLAVDVVARRLGAGAPERLRGEVGVTVTHFAGEADAAVVALVAVARAADARREARALADRGNYEGAAARLREAIAALEATPGFEDEDGDVRDAYEALLDDVTAYENRPDREAYLLYRKSQQHYSDIGSNLRGKAKSVISVVSRAGAAPRLPAARLVGGRDGGDPVDVVLDQPSMVIGRTRDNPIAVDSANVSRRHSLVQFQEGSFWVFDLGSTNGTRVNGEAIDHGFALRPGDVIEVGDVRLVFHTGDGDGDGE